MTNEDYKAVLKRFRTNSQTQADEYAVAKFATGHENELSNALERFRKHHQKAENAQMDLFFEKGLMFPFKDENSAIPKQMLRGSLFAPITRGRRKAITDKPVGTFDGGEIRFTGVQLDQGDLDVLLMLTKLLSDFSNSGNVCRVPDENFDFYSRVKFTRYSFLKALGRNCNSRGYKWLKESILRLSSGVIQVVLDGKGMINKPILGASYMSEDGLMAVDMSQEYIKLFSRQNFSFIDTASRLELTGDFTKWLQGFVSTHTGESQYSAEKLKELSGSKQKSIKHWILRQAKPAFEQLKDLDLIKDYSVKGHLFKWIR
jgi:hypothetical protein